MLMVVAIACAMQSCGNLRCSRSCKPRRRKRFPREHSSGPCNLTVGAVPAFCFAILSHVQVGSGQRLVKMFTVEPDTRQNKMQRILNGSKTTRIVRNDAVMSVCVTQTTLNPEQKRSHQSKVSHHTSLQQEPKCGEFSSFTRESDGRNSTENISSPIFAMGVSVDEKMTNNDEEVAAWQGVNPVDLSFETILATPKLNHLFRRFVIQKFSLSMFSCWKDLGMLLCPLHFAKE